MKNIVIIGASGHGSMVLDCIEKEGRYSVIGFLDSYRKKGDLQNGYEILGSEMDLPECIEKFNIAGVIPAIGNNWTRKLMMDAVEKMVPGLEVVSAIHPSAQIGKDVEIGRGTVIMAGGIINANSTIGKCCIVNTNSSLGHDGIMSDFSTISSGVCTGGNLYLGQFSALSLGTNVIENIRIGENCLVGAGSLVVKDVGDHSVAYGSPARFVRKRKVDDPYLSGDLKSTGSPVPTIKSLNPRKVI